MRERERAFRVESTDQAASKSGLNLECSPLFTDASANVSHGGVGDAPATAGESDHRGRRVGRSNRRLCRRGRSSSHGYGVLVGILLVLCSWHLSVRGCFCFCCCLVVVVFGLLVVVVILFSVWLNEAPSSFFFGRFGSLGVWVCLFIEAKEAAKPLWGFAHFGHWPRWARPGPSGFGLSLWFWGRICSEKERERGLFCIVYCGRIWKCCLFINTEITAYRNALQIAREKVNMD